MILLWETSAIKSPLPFFKQLALFREILKITVMGRMLNAWLK